MRRPWWRRLLPSIEDTLLTIGAISVPVGIGLIASVALDLTVSIGCSVLVAGALALAGGVLLGRTA